VALVVSAAAVCQENSDGDAPAPGTFAGEGQSGEAQGKYGEQPADGLVANVPGVEDDAMVQRIGDAMDDSSRDGVPADSAGADGTGEGGGGRTSYLQMLMSVSFVIATILILGYLVIRLNRHPIHLVVGREHHKKGKQQSQSD